MSDLLQLFDSLTVPEPNTGCLLWLGRTTSGGYARQREFGRVARWVIENIRGESVVGLYACHRCNTPACVSPDHLYPGTPRQNTADAIAAGTFWNKQKAIAVKWESLMPAEREQLMSPLWQARDRHWASQSAEERSARAANGLRGIAEWRKNAPPSVKAEVLRKMSEGPTKFWEELRRDPERMRAWTAERARKSWASRKANANKGD